MKIKVGDLKIDIKTLIEIRIEERLPRLYIHEKFEKQLKWLVWTIATISFISVFIVLDSHVISVSIGLGLFILSFIFNRAIVKYTTIIVQPYPDFTIDYSQWYNVMTISEPDCKKNVNIVGFVYKDIDYGRKFFKYIKSWNFDMADDKEKNIILSIIEESNGAFTFYIYASPYRKKLDKMLKAVAADNFTEKKKEGKIQEGLIMQMAYWKKIKYIDDKHIRSFLKNQASNETFIFIPTTKLDNGYGIDIESQIILHGYKYSKRQDLHKYSTENQLTEMAKKWKY